MKKLLVLMSIFTAVFAVSANAQQGGGDPAAVIARMKETVKPSLIEKAKITDAQADKVIEINVEMRQQMRGLRDLSEDERKKKREEIQVEINKKYKAVPLTDEQIKAVNEYFEERRKEMQKQREGGTGNG